MRYVDFRCLGALEVIIEGKSLSTGGPLQRGLLATLLINANRIVGADRIIDMLWDRPPDTALGQVQTRVWRLRQMLHEGENRPENSARPQLITRAGGYSLMLEPEMFDLMVFDQRTQRAQALLNAEQPAEAATELRGALALWRGPAFADIAAPGIRAEAEAIEERRFAAIEQRMEVELALGLHQQIVPELRELVSVHPFRERLRYHLMRALHRSGRRAEAIEAYLEGYHALVDGLGLEPGRELKDMYRTILASDGPDELGSAMVAEPISILPKAQDLPRDSICLVGREQETAALGDHLKSGGNRNTPAVVALSGVAGVGKSALAVRIGHLLAGDVADGQFYARLGGGSDAPLVVLRRFLRTLGVRDAEVPESLDECSALYRAFTAQLRFMVLLDDVESEAQVRPLLPGNRGGVALITSRRRLMALESVYHRELDRLCEADLVTLLARIVGPERVAAEPGAVGRIVRHCAGLPLALRAVAARICARPHWPLVKFAAALDDDQRRLDVFTSGDLDVRGAIATSYLRLDEVARRLFRLLGLVGGRRFSAVEAGRLLDVPPQVAEEVIEHLVEARLVSPVWLAGDAPQDELSYQIDDLWWLFASERVAVEEASSERLQAQTRLGQY